jgi:hypothetical protein
MFNVRLLQRWLLVFVPIIGASILATYFLDVYRGNLIHSKKKMEGIWV